METPIFEIVVVVDACGDYAVGQDQDQARENYAINEAEAIRYVRLNVSIPLPAVAELVGSAPAEGTASMTIKE